MKIFLRCVLVAWLGASALAQSNGPLASFAFSDAGVPGRFGSGLLFTAASHGQSLPVTGIASAFTLETWIDPSAFGWSSFWYQADDGPSGNAIYELSTMPGGTVYFNVYLGGANYPLFTTPALALNTWTHVAVTYDGAHLRIFFNAVEVASRFAAGLVAATSQPMVVGAGFQGSIDEVRVYNRALTAGEIALDRATPIDVLEPLQVSVVTPADHALGISTTPITGTFSADVDPATITASTFQLRDSASVLVPASVAYDPPTRTATLTPSSTLAPLTDYTASMAGVAWTFRTAAPASKPRVAYAFSEGSGAVVADASGNGNAGTLLRGAGWTAGLYGNAVQFDGINDNIQIPSRDTTTVTSAFTFEAWVKPNAYAWGDLWSQYPTDGGNFIYDLALTNTGALYAAPYLGNAYYPMFTAATLPLDAWTHVALTYDGAWLRIYMDGLEVASRTAHGTLAATENPMELGLYFHGALDEVRVYDRALDAAEILADRQTPVDDRQSTIASLTPGSGSIGQSVTIAGVNFGAVQASSTVTFGDAIAAVTSWTATTIVAVVPAGASSGPVVVTRQGVPSNGVAFAITGPRISAAVSPPPNALGWNSSSVTVTFTCTAVDSPISFCTPPQAVSFSGAAIRITGRAIDQNGVTAAMVVTLNVDLAGPMLQVYAPAASAVFVPGTTTVTIKGSAVDVLSGMTSVTCAGVAATIAGQNFTCPAAVHDGTNSVHLEAFDAAGRLTALNTSILVGDVAPTSVTVSPATTTVLDGETQALIVTDERGRTVSGGTWNSSNAGVATVSVDGGVPTVHALAPGSATVSLTRDGLSAQAAVTVLAAGAVPPDGTTLWSLAATPNPQPAVAPGIREIVRAIPIDLGLNPVVPPPALFFVEHGPYNINQDTTVVPTVIRAVTADGRELWKYTLPPDPIFGGYAPVRQVAPDDRGGLLVLVSSARPACCYFMNEVIRRLDGLNGQVSWEFRHRETFGRFSEFAIHPNGNIFVVEKLSNANTTDLVIVDGATGYEKGRLDLTALHFTSPNASNATGPLVQDDGSIVAVVSRWDNANLWQTTPKSAWLARLAYGDMSASFTLQQLHNADGSPVNFGIADIISGPWPDGHGGYVIGGVSALSASGGANVVHIGGDLLASPIVSVASGAAATAELQYVLSDDGAYVLSQGWRGSYQPGAQLFSLNPATLGVLTSTSLPTAARLQLVSATAGGGVLYGGRAEGYATQVSQSAMAGVLDTGPLMQQHNAVPVGFTAWNARGGHLGRRETRDLKRGIFVQGYPLVGPLSHSSLRLVPRNQQQWSSDSRFYQDSDFNWTVTLGAESSSLPGCGGSLLSSLNRPGDTQTPLLYFQRALYPNDREDSIIRELFEAFGNYHNDLPYPTICVPLPSDGTYNSNSYTHGLINATSDLIADPIIAESLLNFPGWLKPVPRINFLPH